MKTKFVIPGNIAPIQGYNYFEEYSDAGGKLAEAARRAAQKAREVAERAREAAEKATKQAREAGERAAQKAREAAQKGTQAAKNVANKAKKAADKAKDKAKKVGEKAKKAGKKLRKTKKPFARFNPKNAASRAAALVALRANAFGVSTRLAPAILSDQGFKPEARAQAQPKWAKVKKHWLKLGGNDSKLEDAVKTGYRKRPSKGLAKKVGFKKHSSAEGDEFIDVPAEEEGKLAGIPIIGSIIKLIKGLFNPFKKGSEPEGFDGIEDEFADGDELSLDEDIPDVGEDGSPIDTETGEEIAGEEIMGIPKPAFWLGLAGAGITFAIISVALYKRSKNKVAAAPTAV